MRKITISEESIKRMRESRFDISDDLAVIFLENGCVEFACTSELDGDSSLIVTKQQAIDIAETIRVITPLNASRPDVFMVLYHVWYLRAGENKPDLVGAYTDKAQMNEATSYLYGFKLGDPNTHKDAGSGGDKVFYSMFRANELLLGGD